MEQIGFEGNTHFAASAIIIGPMRRNRHKEPTNDKMYDATAMSHQLKRLYYYNKHFNRRFSRSGLFEELEQLVGGVFGVDLGDDIGDAVIGISDKGGAHGAHILAARHLLFLPHTESLVHLG